MESKNSKKMAKIEEKEVPGIPVTALVSTGTSIQVPPDELPALQMLYQKLIDSKLTACDIAMQAEQAKARQRQALFEVTQNHEAYMQRLTNIGTTLKLDSNVQWNIDLKNGTFNAVPMTS